MTPLHLATDRTRMPPVREFLQTGPGRLLSFGAVLVGLCLAGYSIWANFKPSAAEANSRLRWFVNVDTGKPFQVEMTVGQTYPLTCPDTGAKSGYLAELCYWTADGQVKQDPDKVVLNQLLGKHGPTFCPVCHRLVVMHNPNPLDDPSLSPPPTEAEWRAAHGQ
jgi:hypothetical protein